MKLFKYKLLNISILRWIITTLIFAVFYLIIIIRMGGGDPTQYAQIIYLSLQNNTFPAQFVFYGLAYIIGQLISPITDLFIPITLQLLGRDPNVIVLDDFLKYFGAIIFIMSTSTTAKLFSTHYICEKFLYNKTQKQPHLSKVIAFSLLVIQPYIFFNFKQQHFGYLGYNVWHNSTTITLMPIVLWIFYLVNTWISNPIPNRKTILLLILSSSIGLFIKPSFFFVFFIAFPLYNFIISRFSPKFYKSLYIVAIPSVLLIIQYLLVYVYNTKAYGSNSSGIEIAPFKLWYDYSNGNILIYTIASYIFILSAFILLFRNLKYNKLLLFSTICTIGSILIFILFKETGFRASDGNFMWQIFPSNYLLFLLLTVLWIKNSSQLKKWKNNLLLFLFSGHVIFGLIYIIKIIITGSYA